MKTGLGINTIIYDGKPTHILDLPPEILCQEWTKLKKENNRIYEYNRKLNTSWKGFILRLLRIRLPTKEY
ncbi:TPA: hypothetical protein SMT61_003570 [Proteus mirabilis]|uniref:hypothetical protein n=1 Tax=Proteus mirabilis TaxID=584 RepID=UPI0029DEBCC6|nr:hypothetical protein [Proteus mirabilis]HEK1205928.1 hypothetical protein [Proteus mirabilis]HEK2780562.1 hypothetical protein [Proteus mirabilis]